VRVKPISWNRNDAATVTSISFRPGVNFKSATYVLRPRGSGRVSLGSGITRSRARVMGHGTCGDGLGGLGFRLARSFFVLIRRFDLI
jgi:hypothetical protein